MTSPARSGARLVALVCTAQVFVQIGAFYWPALLPQMMRHWSLTNGEAGWITSAFYGAYMLAVPVLVTLTDRVDAKRVYLFGVGCTVVAHLAFGLLAEGFWSAMALRALAQSMARELGPMGVHVAHTIIDGAIDTEFIRTTFPERYALKDQDGILNPAHIADAYWMLHQQPRDAWTHELDLRPYMEKF